MLLAMQKGSKVAEGILHYSGLSNFKRDKEKAFEILNKVIEGKEEMRKKEKGLCLYVLAMIYNEGGNQIQRDSQKALDLIKQAIELGDVMSINYLALFKQKGK